MGCGFQWVKQREVPVFGSVWLCRGISSVQVWAGASLFGLCRDPEQFIRVSDAFL